MVRTVEGEKVRSYEFDKPKDKSFLEEGSIKVNPKKKGSKDVKPNLISRAFNWTTQAATWTASEFINTPHRIRNFAQPRIENAALLIPNLISDLAVGILIAKDLSNTILSCCFLGLNDKINKKVNIIYSPINLKENVTKKYFLSNIYNNFIKIAQPTFSELEPTHRKILFSSLLPSPKTIFALADNYAKAKINPRENLSKIKFYWKTSVQSRFTYARGATVALIAGVADIALGLVGAAFSITSLGIKGEKIYAFTYRQLSALSNFSLALKGIRGIIKPSSILVKTSEI